MMDKELKAKWIAALRSGKYKQGAGELKTSENSFCCLGVLADVIAPDDWMTCPDTDRPIGNSKVSATGDGFYIKYKYLDDQDIQAKLAKMNDSRDYSFTDIADYIEENL